MGIAERMVSEIENLMNPQDPSHREEDPRVPIELKRPSKKRRCSSCTVFLFRPYLSRDSAEHGLILRTC